MTRAHRSNEVWIRMALPVLSGSILRAGAQIEVFSPLGDPRTTKVPPSSVYGVRTPFELAPMFFSDFLDIDGISAEEGRNLGEHHRLRLMRTAALHLDASKLKNVPLR